MNRTYARSFTKGLTLLEITIGMFILTVGVISFIGVMGNISKAVRMSKSRGLAVNLAQERIESLKNISYYRLLVTTGTTSSTESGITSFPYDNGYYPPETITVGQIQFTRRVMIEKVTENSGTLLVGNWWDVDTGLKLITSHVLWQEGSTWKKVTVTNLRDNPNRLKIDSTFTGTVLSTASTVIQNANVVILQNPAWKATTNGTGSFTISVSSGAYELRATKQGYFPRTITSTVAASASQSVPFVLTAKGYGAVTGTAYLANHLLISEICATVNSDPLAEYVELYNPTQSTYTVSSSYEINFVATAAGTVTHINPAGSTIYVNNTIYPNHFFVIGSAPNINGVLVDAYYSDSTLTASVPADRIIAALSGGVALASIGVYETLGSTVDAVGWGHTGSSPYGPVNAREGNGIFLPANGLGADEVIERIAYSTSTEVAMSVNPLGPHATFGNGYDTNDNDVNWILHPSGNNDVPNNTSTIERPQSATPASSALIFVDDGLSASRVASSTGAFTVTVIATGTWSILASSAGYSYSNESGLSITNATTLNVGNVIIAGPSTLGYASGLVKTALNVPIPSISVTTSGGSDTTDSNGYYRFRLDVGTYTMLANPNNADGNYTTEEATGVVVNAGQAVEAKDIILYQGGKLRGWVTTNGTDALPGVPINATELVSGAQMGSSISDSQGFFNFSDMPVHSYVLTPQLDTGESASPLSITRTVVANSVIANTTFTVTNGFGFIAGSVKKSSVTIVSGVIIIAVSTGTTIGANPPTINSTLRAGATVYYSDSSDGDGNYRLSLRRGSYNLYGWYTTYNVNTPQTTQIYFPSVTVVAGSTTGKNFSF